MSSTVQHEEVAEKVNELLLGYFLSDELLIGNQPFDWKSPPDKFFFASLELVGVDPISSGNPQSKVLYDLVLARVVRQGLGSVESDGRLLQFLTGLSNTQHSFDGFHLHFGFPDFHTHGSKIPFGLKDYAINYGVLSITVQPTR